MIFADVPIDIDRTEQGIINGAFDLIGIYGISRQTKELVAKFHPCDRYAGFLHDAREGWIKLSDRGMVEKLVRGSRATDDGNVGFHDQASKIDSHRFIFFFARYAVIFENTLEIGDHFVSLGYGVFVWMKLAFQSGFKNVEMLTTALVDDVFCKIKVFFVFCQIVKQNKRL